MSYQYIETLSDEAVKRYKSADLVWYGIVGFNVPIDTL